MHYGILLDPSKPMICLPKDQVLYIQSPPSSPTNISIELSYIQIIEIDVKLNQLTANMEFRVIWTKNGLNLVTPANQWITIKEKAIRQRIWSPGIDIRKNLVTQKSKNHKLQFAKKDNKITWLSMSYDLSTRLKCNMYASTFPFDEQECTIEVSTMQFKICFTHLISLVSYSSV